MNLTESLARFVNGNAIAPFQEAAPGSPVPGFPAIDSDEHLFRSLIQQTRDLGAITLDKQREIAYHLADTNPFAKRIVHQGRDYVVGDADKWTIHAEDPKVQELLQAHWDDPVNAWVDKLESRVRETSIVGEQCYTATTGPDGIVRLGYVDSGRIAVVKQNSDNCEILEEITLKKKSVSEDPKVLKIINYDMEEGRLVGIGDKPADQTKYADSCFFWRLNAPITATRGRSDLFALADALDMLDRFHWNRMERAALMNAFFWDVTVKGMSEPELKEWAKGQTVPKPGAMRIHNENVEWEAVTPNLQGQDASAEGLMMQTPVLVGSGLPRHLLMGTGDDANRASAYEMGDPPMRMHNTRQLFIVRMIYRVFRYQIDEAKALGQLSGVPAKLLYKYSLDVPEIQRRDVAKLASALESLGRTVSALLGRVVSTETAVRQYAFVSSQLGYEIDADDELKRLKDEAEGQDEKDVGGLVLPPAKKPELAPADEEPEE